MKILEIVGSYRSVWQLNRNMLPRRRKRFGKLKLQAVNLLQSDNPYFPQHNPA